MASGYRLPTLSAQRILFSLKVHGPQRQPPGEVGLDEANPFWTPNRCLVNAGGSFLWAGTLALALRILCKMSS